MSKRVPSHEDVRTFMEEPEVRVAIQSGARIATPGDEIDLRQHIDSLLRGHDRPIHRRCPQCRLWGVTCLDGISSGQRAASGGVSDIRQRERTRRFAIDVRESILAAEGRGHHHASRMTQNLGISEERCHRPADEVR